MSNSTARADYEDFVRASTRPLMSLAFVLAGNAHDAEDLVQETFIRVARHWGTVARDGGMPLAYAKTTLHRLHIDRYRWRRRRPESPTAYLPERAGDTSDVEGRLQLDDATLAGSNLTMDEAVRHGVNKLGVPLADALQMASRNPAGFLGRGDLGIIAPGALASLVHLDDNLNVKRTWVEGR